jgi:hypothetical protein
VFAIAAAVAVLLMGGSTTTEADGVAFSTGDILAGTGGGLI